eukprot:1151810-Pelagomonas_calceolata.AAC.5
MPRHGSMASRSQRHLGPRQQGHKDILLQQQPGRAQHALCNGRCTKRIRTTWKACQVNKHERGISCLFRILDGPSHLQTVDCTAVIRLVWAAQIFGVHT